MLQMSRTAKFGLIVIVAFVLAFLYIPLFVVVVNSFNEAQLSSWPVQNFSLYWWEFAATYEPIRLALLNSVIVATAAMVIASILGTLVAFALNRLNAYTLLQAFGQHPRKQPEPVREALARVWISTLYGSEWFGNESSDLVRK